MKKMKILIGLLLVTAMIFATVAIGSSEAVKADRAAIAAIEERETSDTAEDTGIVLDVPDKTSVLTEIEKSVPERASEVGIVQKAFLGKKPAPCCNKRYEELKAVGFYPPERRLEAIINIKQKYGYNANEFVSFWIDWNNDKVFTNDELVGIENVYIKNPENVQLPLEYAVYTDVVPPPGTTGVKKAKATLSGINPVFYPYTAPIFGNSITTNIRIDPIS